MPFKKGDKNINRKGRPTGTGHKQRRQLLEDQLSLKDMYKMLIAEAKDPEARPADRITAIKTLLAYAEGNPTQRKEIMHDVADGADMKMDISFGTRPKEDIDDDFIEEDEE